MKLDVDFNKLSNGEEIQINFTSGTPFYSCPEFTSETCEIYKGQFFILKEDLPLYGKVLSTKNANKGFIFVEINKFDKKFYIEVNGCAIQVNTKWWEL